MIGNNLEIDFTYLKRILRKEYRFENKDKKFDIEFINGEFKNLGKWNFLPSIYKNQFKNHELLNIDNNNLKIINLGSKTLLAKRNWKQNPHLCYKLL